MVLEIRDGIAREYTAPSPRRASIMPWTNDHRGTIAGYKVFDAEENLVAHLYAGDMSEDDVRRCRDRARALADVLDGE